ncbi:SH2 domain-containing protein 1A-like isoform X5 [Paramormyrops kingsleyae]|uniref:SH2 domain-containing protein 1A-like isoform X5 n=1 Tax=Paramormyrops kingsleyae TaxID=1676925 RepID=UPI000CD640AB|nr:SH2 domain-containing protein 1A-like isoform X5 [Paramormyrops kingsleyae]
MFRSIYFGKISKEKTERLLELYGKEGSFLTRDSESERGAYCLCVRRTPFVHTYKISQYHGGWAVKSGRPRQYGTSTASFGKTTETVYLEM